MQKWIFFLVKKNVKKLITSLNIFKTLKIPSFLKSFRKIIRIISAINKVFIVANFIIK